MRTPKSWNDKGVLEDEPLRSAFEAFEKSAKQFQTRSRERNQLVKKLNDSEKTAINLWHGKCLALSKKRPTTGKNHERKVEIEYRTVQTFVDFYWNLFIGDDATAITCLTRLLMSQGYDFVGPALTDNATTATILTNSINISHSDLLNMGKSSLPVQPDHIKKSGKTKVRAVDIPLNKHARRKAPPPNLRTKGTKSTKNRPNLVPVASGSLMLDAPETKISFSEFQNGNKCFKDNGDTKAGGRKHHLATEGLLVCNAAFIPGEDEVISGTSTKQYRTSQACDSVDTVEKNRSILKGLRFKKIIPASKSSADIDHGDYEQSAFPTSFNTQQIKSEEIKSEGNAINPFPSNQGTPARLLFSPVVPPADDMAIVPDTSTIASNLHDDLSLDVRFDHAGESQSTIEPKQSELNLQKKFQNMVEKDTPNEFLPMKRERSLSIDCPNIRSAGHDLIPGPVDSTGKGDEESHPLGPPEKKRPRKTSKSSNFVVTTRVLRPRPKNATDKPITTRKKIPSNHLQASSSLEGSSACSRDALWGQSAAKNTTPLIYPSTSFEASSFDSSSITTTLNQRTPNSQSNSSSEQGVPLSTTRKRKLNLNEDIGIKTAFKVVMKRPRPKVVPPSQKRTSNRLQKAGAPVVGKSLLPALHISPDSPQDPEVQIKQEPSEVLPHMDVGCIDSIPTLLDDSVNKVQLQTEDIGLGVSYIGASNSEEKLSEGYLVGQDALPALFVPLKQETVDSDQNMIGSVEGPSKIEETEPYIEAPFDQPPDTERYYYLPKPALPELPPIWAESRQEICESFDWFRSYQGGVYHAHNAVKGYLLGGFPSSRDRFEHGGRLIISHGGGKAESLHTKKGKTTCHAASDQMAQDKSVRALYDNYVNNRPLVLLMDDKYALFPHDLKSKSVAYAVLGLYTIVYAWAEYQPANNELGRVVRYKFAFRWCDHQGIPWWNFEGARASSVESDPFNVTSRAKHNMVREIGPAKTDEFVVSQSFESSPDTVDSYPERFLRERRELSLTCNTCLRRFVRIFEASWVCLNPECRCFWRQADGRFLPIQLDYHPNFLELPLSKPNTDGLETIAPESPLSFLYGDSTTNYAFTRGFHCTSCGRLSCRYKWETWECMHCGHSITIERPPRDIKDLLHQGLSVTFKDYSLNPISGITALPQATFVHDAAGRGFIQTFILPYTNARIHHIQSGGPQGRMEADQIFLDYQVQATKGTLKFRRWPMRAHKCRGSLLTNYFSQNSGVPYKYVGGDLNTVPFESAPDAVVKARSLMEKRLIEALGVKAEFNEVLSAAYMERQKMAFHSDNEVGLGPLVAGLSLGSPALMHFRLHPKFDPERMKKGILLSVVLRHGDILVMDGSSVQEYYEHTVVPTNFRIAATARQINATLHA